MATDAACEGLNLQTLGTLTNVDLPWNPARLEQRLGCIKRFGQARRTLDMLNLVYHDTQDEKVYQVLSRRMKDRYDILGGLPGTIEDDWAESVEKLEEMMVQPHQFCTHASSEHCPCDSFFRGFPRQPVQRLKSIIWPPRSLNRIYRTVAPDPASRAD